MKYDHDGDDGVPPGRQKVSFDPQPPAPVVETGFRAENEYGRTYRDPSAGQLWRLLAELAPENRFLVLIRLDHPGGEYYAQVRFAEPGHYDVEYRDGSAAEQYAAVVPDVPTAHAVLTGWAASSPDWRGTLAWERIDVE